MGHCIQAPRSADGKCVSWLLPLLLGEAQTVALSMPPASWGSFVDVCQALLNCLGLSPEDNSRHFWATWMTIPSDGWKANPLG